MTATLVNASRNALGTAEVIAFDLVAEIALRAGSIARGDARTHRSPSLPAALRTRLDSSERRARRLAAHSDALAPAAALEFAGQALAAAAIDGPSPDGAAAALVKRLAGELEIADAEAALMLFRSAVCSYECAQLPPGSAIDLVLWLLVDLGAVAGASLWAPTAAGELDCLAAAGRGGRSRRMRETARASLEDVTSDSDTFRAVSIERWDQPFAALCVRSRTGTIDGLLAEAAAALSPVLERDAVYQGNVARERELVAAGERRLVRLGFDLHDGPLQEVVAFAEDLRIARTHIAPLLDDEDARRATGCFDDLGARLESLDRDLRQIAHSVRSTTALDRPLGDALQSEVDAIARAGVDANLVVGGDLDSLTDSQKIVIYRVVQEALNNVRKHSLARSAEVFITTTARLISIVVADDGRGIDPGKAARADRLGLAGVTERVRLLGGVVTIDGASAGGTRIAASIPRWRSHADSTRLSYAATA